jgi:predicted dehydrogenase
MTILYGTIGTGWITDSWISAASRTKKWQLHAVYSRTQEQAEKFASKYDYKALYTSLSDLASDKELQAVYVASPNSHHYAHAKQMLQAGKHVILEKPATSTPDELNELFVIAKEKGVFLIEAFRHIAEANFKLLDKMLNKEKRLGPIYGASFTYASYSSRYNNVLAGEKPNIFSLEYSGGSLVDIGVYPVTFAVALFGAPKTSTYVPYICATGVDGGGVIILQYETFGVQINNSKSYQSFAPCEIYGEKGTISINATAEVETISHWDPKTKKSEELAGPKIEVEKPNVSMVEEAEDFARMINDKDHTEAARLEKISKDVIKVTSEMRRQNGILYPADKS